MNKSKLLSIALVCALGLGVTSCVDDKESASVEAVRNAKAEQLKALAAYQNAQAESTMILANADAAIKAAEAKAKEITNELADIELQKAKAGLTAALEAAQMNAEAELATAKAALESAKAELIAALDQVSVAEKERITTLLGKADAALGDLNTAKTALVGLQADKVAAEYELTDAELLKAKNIAANNKTIATSKALIAEYEKYSQEDKANAQKAADAAKAKLEGLDNVLSNANVAVTKAAAEQDKAYLAVENSEYMQKVNSSVAWNYVSQEVWKEGGLQEYTYDDGQYGSYYVQDYTAYTDVDASRLSKDIADAGRQVTVAETALKEAQKVLTDRKAEQGYKDAQKALTDAQKEFNDAKTSAEKDAARIKVQDAQNALDNYASAEEAAVEGAEDAVADAKENLQELTDAEKVLTGAAYTKYVELITADYEAQKALDAAYIAADKADHNYDVQDALASSLQAVADGLIDYAELINGEESTVNTKEKENADYRSINTKEDLIKKLESQIALKQVEIASLESIYNAYKAEIDALMAE